MWTLRLPSLIADTLVVDAVFTVFALEPDGELDKPEGVARSLSVLGDCGCTVADRVEAVLPSNPAPKKTTPPRTLKTARCLRSLRTPIPPLHRTCHQLRRDAPCAPVLALRGFIVSCRVRTGLWGNGRLYKYALYHMPLVYRDGTQCASVRLANR